MIHFADAQYLLLILLIPFFYVAYFFYKKNRRKQIEKIGDMQLMEKLMPYRSRAKGWVRLTFFSLAWFFFLVGMARPQLGARIKETQRTGSEIMIALDVSNSMLAEDYTPNRLERAKLAISRIVDKLQGDRIGLIVFAGQSFVQLPITTDYVSAKIFLNTIDNKSVPVQGTALGEAISTAIKSFSTDAAMHEDNKAIILITDGENHEDNPVDIAKTAAELGIKVFCIGVGSPDGKPIPMGEDGQLLKDKDGNIVVTKLDKKILEEVAMAGNGAYIRASNSEFGLNPIIDELKDLESKKYESVVFEDFDEQYMYFFGIALFFLLLEFLVGSRRVNKRMFALVLMLSVSSVGAFAQVDKKEVRKGNSFFKNDKYKEAEVEYRKALLKDSLSVAANYNLGNTLLKNSDAANAEKIYGSIADSVGRIKNEVDWSVSQRENPTVASDYYYNLGNSYLEQKKYSEAVEAYKNSLMRNPNDMDAKENYMYAKKKLEDQQNNQQNQDQNQNQDQQNQDQQNQNQPQQQPQQNEQEKKQDENKNDNKENDQNKDPQQQQGNPPKIKPQEAEQMLKAIQEKENETKEKVNEEKAKLFKSRQKEKNW